MQSGVGAQQYRRDVASMRLCDKESQRPWERERWELAKECQERGVRLLRNARNEARYTAPCDGLVVGGTFAAEGARCIVSISIVRVYTRRTYMCVCESI